MTHETDVVVVGAGPAGLAAGIWARLNGLECTLVERSGSPRPKPGETLHPGVGAILRQLGVESEVAAASGIRHPGVMTIWSTRRGFVSYGDDKAPQLGYQILRQDLNTILLRRFRELGGTALLGTRAVAPIHHATQINGVSTRMGDIRARVTVDASGPTGWLRRFVDAEIHTRSPALLARYGYARGRLPYAATLQGDSSGWSWTAQVQPDLVQWTAMAFSTLGRSAPPDAVRCMEPVGTSRSAPVTWRRTSRAAGPGFFIAGDAATTLDPASSHGVLRALMSGMMATHHAALLLRGEAGAGDMRSYSAWIRDWSERDMHELARLYAELDVDWAIDFVSPSPALTTGVEAS